MSQIEGKIVWILVYLLLVNLGTTLGQQSKQVGEFDYKASCNMSIDTISPLKKYYSYVPLVGTKTKKLKKAKNETKATLSTTI